MKKCFLIAAIALASLSQAAAAAETLSLSWTNPTTSIDGVPLTGANALTAIEVYCATAPIDDNATLVPLATLGVIEATQATMSANRGDTVYCRLKAVRGTEKSAFSTQASKLIPLSTVPGVPTSLQITIVTP